MLREPIALVSVALCALIACGGPNHSTDAAVSPVDAAAQDASTVVRDGALDAGAGSHDAAATSNSDQFSLSKNCGAKPCGLIGVVGFFEPCCVGAEAEGVCGISTYGGPCITRVYGRTEPSCPRMPTLLGTFPGCCRPDDRCGFVTDVGCAAAYLPDGSVPQACAWDQDAGASEGDAGS